MKTIVLIASLLFLFMATSFAQKIINTQRASGHSIYVIGDNFEGVIFKMNYERFLNDTIKQTKFTPSFAEIEAAENLLDIGIDTAKDHLGFGEGKFIHVNLARYIRQYFGYYNKAGEKIIFINSFCRSSGIMRYGKWKKNLVYVYDGGKCFWNIKVNLSAKTLFSFWINGV